MDKTLTERLEELDKLGQRAEADLDDILAKR